MERNIAKLSFNFNYNLVESWDSINFIFQTHPPTGVHKTGIRGIQDTRQIVDGKTNDSENNDKKGGSKPLT